MGIDGQKETVSAQFLWNVCTCLSNFSRNFFIWALAEKLPEITPK